jgi:hypothetical protein
MVVVMSQTFRGNPLLSIYDKYGPVSDPTVLKGVGSHSANPAVRESWADDLGSTSGHQSTGARKFWQPSPDTEEIRQHLLSLVGALEQRPPSEYPIGAYVDEVVLWQLGEFREVRALASLRRIANFDPSAKETGPFGRTRQTLVQIARDAIAGIEGGPA